MKFCGRPKIYTKYSEITSDNILDCLAECISQFRNVQREIKTLKEFEAGDQDLCHASLGRMDIDIHEIDNLAGYATDFHTAHFWGNPPMLVQRGQSEIHETDGEADSNGISALNEYINNQIAFQREFGATGFSCEQTGVGYVYVDIATPENARRYNRYFEVHNLDALNSFVAYANEIDEPKVLGVTMTSNKSGYRKITAFTDTQRFDIDEATGTYVSYPNRLGIIPIIEFTRFIDRTSCFEKCIPSLKAHNTKVSDFDNDYAQSVYAIWWMNDADLPKDDNGDDILPESGQWIQTYSGEGKNPLVQALVPNIDRASVLNSIQDSRSWNLSKMYVPVNNDISGGSTGVAESMASGWEVVGTIANLKEVLAKSSMREVVDLMLRAIEQTSTDVIPADSDIREIHLSDIDFHFDRKHNYDMSTKANVIATLIKVGVNPLHVLRVANLFDDPQQVAIDSPNIAKYQETLVKDDAPSTEEKETVQEMDDQNKNSPIIDNG